MFLCNTDSCQYQTLHNYCPQLTLGSCTVTEWPWPTLHAPVYPSTINIKVCSQQQWQLRVSYTRETLQLLSLTYSWSMFCDLVTLTYFSDSSDWQKSISHLSTIYIKVYFSAAVIAKSVKPCIVIVLDTLWSWPTFALYLAAAVIAVGVKPCIEVVLGLLTSQAYSVTWWPWPTFCAPAICT